jgi:hypothetical protein
MTAGSWAVHSTIIVRVVALRDVNRVLTGGCRTPAFGERGFDEKPDRTPAAWPFAISLGKASGSDPDRVDDRLKLRRVRR